MKDRSFEEAFNMSTMTSTVVLTVLAISSLALSGCSGDPEGSGSESPTAGGASTAPGGTSEYAVSCSGKVTPLGIGAATIGLRCGDDDSGLRGGCGDDPCAAQAVEIRHEAPAPFCASTNVYAWDGKACVAHPTATDQGEMRCKGDGCMSLYPSEADCTKAHASCEGT